MARTIAQINALPGADTFAIFIEKSKNVITFVSEEAVSVNNSANGATVTGNGSVLGTLSVNVSTVTEFLRGGNVTTANVLNISSNVLIGTGNTLSIGNSTVNAFTNSSFYRVGTIQSTSAFVNALSGGVSGTPAALNIISNTIFATTTNIILGNFFTNSSVLMIGTEMFVNSDHIRIGNSTVNSLVNSTQWAFGNVNVTRSTALFGNSTVNLSINSVSLGIYDATNNLVSNTSQLSFGSSASNLTLTPSTFSVGNSTVNATINSTSFTLSGTPIAGKSTYVSSNTDLQTVDSFVKATWRSAEYLISIENVNGYQVSKVLLTHDGSDAYMTEYGIISSNGTLCQFSASANATHVLMQGTPVYASTTTYKIIETLIEV